MKIWLNGHITDERHARISVLDHGLLYGDGVFEGIRVSCSRIVDLELHLERLQASARAIWLETPPLSALRQIVVDTLSAHGHANAYARLVVTRGVGALGIGTEGCTPTTFCIAGDITMVPEAQRKRGISMITSSLRRPAADALDPSVKSLNYLNNVLAKLEAKRQGADEALVLNARGLVAEASAANVFILKGTELRTPPYSDGCLPGLTRRRIIKVAPELGLQPREVSLSRYDLLSADEVLLCGSGAGLLPVRSLDGQVLGEAQGSNLEPSSLVARLTPSLERYAQQYGVSVPGLEPPH